MSVWSLYLIELLPPIAPRDDSSPLEKGKVSIFGFSTTERERPNARFRPASLENARVASN